MTDLEALRTQPGHCAFTDKELIGWRDWAEASGLLIRLADETGITGLLIARPCPDFFFDELHYWHQNGAVLIVDALYAKDEDSLKALGQAAVQYFGVRRYVAYKRRGKPRCQRWREFMKKIIGEKLWVDY